MTDLLCSNHKYEAIFEDDIIKLISEVPVIVNGVCYDRKRNQYVLSVGYGTAKNTASEYVILNRDFKIVQQLSETVRGGTPRLLVSPDGSPWVRLMSFESDFTKDIVLPVYDRKSLKSVKKMSIEMFRQELYWNDTLYCIGYSPANSHTGKPDDLILWEFDKNNLFKKKTKTALKFSYNGVLISEGEKLFVCNFIKEKSTVMLTEIDKNGKTLGQWSSEPISGIKTLVPVSVQNNTCVFIGLSKNNTFVHIVCSQNETRISDILTLPEDLQVEELKSLPSASDQIEFIYESRNTNGFIRYDGKNIVLQITSSGENNVHSTKVRGKYEFHLPWRAEIYVLQDGLLILSPYNYYSNEIGEIMILR